MNWLGDDPLAAIGRTGSSSMPGCARRGRRGRRCSLARRRGLRRSRRGRRPASPPARPASSTTAAAMMPGCSAEALSQRSSAHRRPKRCCRGCAPPDRCKRRARGSSPRAVRRAEPDCIGNCRAGRDWQGHDRSRPAKPAGRYLRPQTDCGPRKRSRAKYSEAQRNCRAQRNRRRERPAQRKTGAEKAPGSLPAPPCQVSGLFRRIAAERQHPPSLWIDG